MSGFGEAPETPRCLACLDAETNRQRGRRSREDVLRAAGCRSEALLREPFEVERYPGGRWPTDLRTPSTRRVDLPTWAEGGEGTLVIMGSVGLGKTFLGTELLYRAWKAEPSRSVCWCRAVDLIRELRQRNFGPIVRARRSAALLVDDIHLVPSWGVDTIYDLVDDRAPRPVLTVVTTNLDWSGLARWSPPVADRLAVGLGVSVGRGESMRIPA